MSLSSVQTDSYSESSDQDTCYSTTHSYPEQSQEIPMVLSSDDSDDHDAPSTSETVSTLITTKPNVNTCFVTSYKHV